MAAKMTTRERVERTMAGEETDRVPIYDLLSNDGAFEHYGGEKLPAVKDGPDAAAAMRRTVGKAVGNMLSGGMSWPYRWSRIVRQFWRRGFPLHGMHLGSVDCAAGPASRPRERQDACGPWWHTNGDRDGVAALRL